MTSRALILTISAALTLGVTATTAAAPVESKNMGSVCRSKAASEFGARPNYVKSNRPVPGPDGAATVNGTYEDNDGHTKSFACHYDAKGNFLDVKAVATGKS